MGDVDRCIASLRELLPAEHVFDGVDAIAKRVGATYDDARAPVALIYAENRSQVRDVVTIASQFRVGVYPVSTGRNWGYGSNSPCREHCLLLDMSKMNAILAVDPVLGTATVEPGVTFDQLASHLRLHARRFAANVTGAPGNTSVLGNALERGVGIGRYADRFASVLGLEVLLSSGEIVRTGTARQGTGHLPHRRESFGADLTGLFAQSNLGVVLSMTIPLQRRGSANREIKIGFDGRPRLRKAIDRLRDLRLGGVLDSQFVLWNDYRQFARLMAYPSEFVRGKIIGPRLRRQMRAVAGVREWTLRVCLYGVDKRIVDAHEAVLREQFVGPGFVCSARSIPAWARGSAYVGSADTSSLDSLYWRMDPLSVRTNNPDQDGVGAIWAEFACPLLGSAVDEATAHGSAILSRHGFEPLTMLVGAWERSVTVVFLILYDRRRQRVDESAKRCYRDLLDDMHGRGLAPARLPAFAMDMPAASADATNEVLRRLKSAFDPAGVMSVGRYQPTDDRDGV